MIQIWDPSKDYRDRTKAISALAEALNGIAAELRTLRNAELEKVVGALKKPTDEVKQGLNNQT